MSVIVHISSTINSTITSDYAALLWYFYLRPKLDPQINSEEETCGQYGTPPFELRNKFSLACSLDAARKYQELIVNDNMRGSNQQSFTGAN